MVQAIEIIQLGPTRKLFQICDGERFGIVEVEDWDQHEHREAMQHPHVAAFLGRWLDEHGVLIGSRHPPYLEWVLVEMAVVAARA